MNDLDYKPMPAVERSSAPKRAEPPSEPARTPQRARRRTPITSRGEPLVWLTGTGLAFSTLMIVALLVLVMFNGLGTFWPQPLVEFTLLDGTRLLGDVTRSERYRPSPAELDSLPAATRDSILESGGWARRRLVRTGNFDLYNEDFRWVSDHEIVSTSFPPDAWLIERTEWGPGIGYAERIELEGRAVAEGSERISRDFDAMHDEARTLEEEALSLEKHAMGVINAQIEEERLAVRRAALDHGESSPEHRRRADQAAGQEEALSARYQEIRERVASLRERSSRTRFVVRDVTGRFLPQRPGSGDPLKLAQIVRAYPANTLTLPQKVGVYLDRWAEFLFDEPREANTEGGVFPAIFGTFVMTVMMSLAVAPFGVMAALYLREYARQGAMISAVRIAVNNLAGVPSIVYGVFGLGFFCYFVGGTIDEIFFPERLPSPTFGTGGILWASLTLALLTVPVVIVATEEALAAVPRSMREGSYACGASRWQTIRRIVLPKATPGIMTGLILAMARGAGEVAPLMITGVVKLAPELPLDARFPFFHLERSFMHLGFHIYDVGFQSRNSEAGKPMVFTTTLLLIGIVITLNLTAIYLRARLKRRFKTSAF